MISLLAAELALSAWGPLAGTLGFSKRSIMNGPDGKPIHAELLIPVAVDNGCAVRLRW